MLKRIISGLGRREEFEKKNPERGRVLSMGIFGTKLKMGVIWI